MQHSVLEMKGARRPSFHTIASLIYLYSYLFLIAGRVIEPI